MRRLLHPDTATVKNGVDIYYTHGRVRFILARNRHELVIKKDLSELNVGACRL